MVFFAEKEAMEIEKDEVVTDARECTYCKRMSHAQENCFSLQWLLLFLLLLL